MQANQAKLTGFSALHQSHRLVCPDLVSLLLDWGADAQTGEHVHPQQELQRGHQVHHQQTRFNQQQNSELTILSRPLPVRRGVINRWQFIIVFSQLVDQSEQSRLILISAHSIDQNRTIFFITAPVDTKGRDQQMEIDHNIQPDNGPIRTKQITLKA